MQRQHDPFRGDLIHCHRMHSHVNYESAGQDFVSIHVLGQRETLLMIIAFITPTSSLVPLLEGLVAQIRINLNSWSYLHLLVSFLRQGKYVIKKTKKAVSPDFLPVAQHIYLHVPRELYDIFACYSSSTSVKKTTSQNLWPRIDSN